MTPYIYAGLSEKDQFFSKNKIKIVDKHEIIQAVCMALEVTKDQLVSPTRKRPIVVARQIAIGLIRKYNPEATLVNIGKLFNRDHSTIIYAQRTFDDLNGRDKVFTQDVLKVLKLTNYT